MDGAAGSRLCCCSKQGILTIPKNPNPVPEMITGTPSRDPAHSGRLSARSRVHIPDPGAPQVTPITALPFPATVLPPQALTVLPPNSVH